jgi:hypothetical protein
MKSIADNTVGELDLVPFAYSFEELYPIPLVEYGNDRGAHASGMSNADRITGDLDHPGLSCGSKQKAQQADYHLYISHLFLPFNRFCGKPPFSDSDVDVKLS